MAGKNVDTELQDCESSQLQAAWVRIGYSAEMGLFGGPWPSNVRRGTLVLCRTQRGLEVGEYLSQASAHKPADGLIGQFLRTLTEEDKLLWHNLKEQGKVALQSCQAWLDEQRIEATLLDVEPLFDGRTLYFHFLSAVDEIVQKELDVLAKLFEERVRESKFSKLLEHGCGPGCGTDKATNGCGSSGGCAVCKIAGACATSRK